MKYELTVETERDIDSMKKNLDTLDIKLLGVKTLQYFYSVNLMVNGELIDSIDVLASSEEEAQFKAYRLFRLGPDYDVVKAKQITLDMIELDRD